MKKEMTRDLNETKALNNAYAAKISRQNSEIARLKKLLYEVCVRANIIMPEDEEAFDWFDEQFFDQPDLHLNIGATLHLGEIDAESVLQNEIQLRKIRARWEQSQQNQTTNHGKE